MAEDSKSPKATTREKRSAKTQKSTPAIDVIRNIVNIIKPYELSKTQRLKTFQAMLLDDAVFAAYNATCVKIENAYSNYEVTHLIGNKRSEKAAQFLKWNLSNLKGQSLKRIARAAADMNRDGGSPFEEVYENGYDEWTTTPDGNPIWKLKKLSYIHPLTLDQMYPFETMNGGRGIKELRQQASALKDTRNQTTYSKENKDGIIHIPWKKVAVSSYSATDSNPFGLSPFDACYTAWREKIFLQDAMLTGVSKDFAGTPVLYIPANILSEASADPTSDAGKMVAQLQDAMAAMHTGDQTNVILPSDTINDAGTGGKKFEFRFAGIDGSGKQWDCDAMIEQRKRAIYNVFGAAHLIAGENSSGGYNQLEGQTNIHSEFVERDCSIIDDMFNQQIIPKLFRLNEWKLTSEELPKLKHGALSEISWDEYGKAFQRLGAGGFIPRTKEVIDSVMKKMNIPYVVPKNMTQEELLELLGKPSSRAGESNGSSGVGETQSGGVNSATNSDNSA